MRLRAFVQVAALAIGFALAACNAESPPASDGAPVTRDTVAASDSSIIDPEVPRTQQRLDSLATAIEAAVGEARADDVARCRTIAYGAKPCGGPWRYLVYSTAATDSTRLSRMVNEYNDTQDYLNRQLGLGSDCLAVGEPTVELENGRCVAAGGADG